MQIEWSWPIGKLFALFPLFTNSYLQHISKVIYISIYVTSLLCMYSLGPTVYRLSNATFLSMSLITSNFYTLLIGLVFLDAEASVITKQRYIIFCVINN